MADSIILYRNYELNFHDNALRSEFAEWQKSAAANAKFEKHNSQITRITDQLTGALDEIKIKNGAQDLDIASSQVHQTSILGIYRIWSYFREKFALRESEHFFNLLKIADELAWACYKPARQAALDAKKIKVEERREPPLVYFSGNISPFALERGLTFFPEGIETKADARLFDSILFKLPVPLVAIPWFQLNHLPAGPAIAHEVGHIVERDFQLTEQLAEVFKALDLPDERKKLWTRWSDELFADIWGTLCCGPGYLMALSEYLITESSVVQGEKLKPDDEEHHPTRMLRLLFNEALLKRYGLLTLPVEGSNVVTDDPDDLQSLLRQPMKRWRETYEFHQMDKYEQDIETVLDGVLSQQFELFGRKKLDKVMQFDWEDLKASWLAARRMLLGEKLKESDSDFRRLYTAVVLAWFYKPEVYVNNSIHKQLVDVRLLGQIPKGKRGHSGISTSAEEQKKTDIAAGAELFDMLLFNRTVV